MFRDVCVCVVEGVGEVERKKRKLKCVSCDELKREKERRGGGSGE